jgi:hypothetical protein
MKNVKKITVKVFYRVELGNIQMHEKAYKQIVQASKYGDDIEMRGMSKYPDAYEFIHNNIREKDCMDWSAEVEEIKINA